MGDLGRLARYGNPVLSNLAYSNWPVQILITGNRWLRVINLFSYPSFLAKQKWGGVGIFGVFTSFACVMKGNPNSILLLHYNSVDSSSAQLKLSSDRPCPWCMNVSSKFTNEDQPVWCRSLRGACPFLPSPPCRAGIFHIRICHNLLI
jgi:hypothetical protein